MIRVAVCDDEPYVCEIIKEKVSELMAEAAMPAEISCYARGYDLLKDGFQYDILFLDVLMPGMDGVDLAKKLREMGNVCQIIFITGFKERVFDAFLVEAVDYLCKPIDLCRLKSALYRALKGLEKKEEKALFIQTMNWSKSVKLGNIYYCEVINRKIYLHTREGTLEYYSRLEDVEKQLDYRFLKCHRSYIVNLDFLSEYSDGQIMLENGDQIPVSRKRRQEFMKIFLQYMKTKGV